MKTALRIFLKWVLIPLLSLCFIITATVYFFKDRICGVVLTEVNTHLKSPIQVSSMDLAFWGSFPNLSVDFEQIFIQDALPNARKTDTLFYSEKVRLSFNPLDIYHGKYHIKTIKVAPGKLSIRYNEKGQGNYDILKPTPAQSSTDFKLSLKELSMESLRLFYQNAVSHQAFQAKINRSSISGDFSSEKYLASAIGRLKLIALKSGEITLLKNKKLDFDLAIDVNQKSGLFCVKRAALQIEHLPFLLTGKVGQDSLKFDLQSKDLQLVQLVNELSLDAAKDVKSFQGKGMVNVHLAVSGGMAANDPLAVKCDFGIENGGLTEPYHGLKIQDIQLVGTYENTEENGEFLSLKNVHCRTAGGPFSGDFLLSEFEHPKVEGEAEGTMNLSIVHAIFKLPSVETIQGNVGIQTKFGLLTNAETGSLDVDHCNGTLQLKNIFLKLKKDKRTFSQVNGQLFLRGNEAGIDNATLKIGGSDLRLNGIFGNIFGYLNKRGDLKTTMLLESNDLHVEDLGTTSKEVKMASEAVFSLPDDIQGEINLQIENLHYDKHLFEHVVGKMNIEAHRLHFPQLSLVNAEALVSGALVIEEKEAEKFLISTQIAGKNLKFKPLFKEWNNFEQTVITDQNISGKAEANLFFRAPFSLSKGINLDGIEAKLDLKVYNGHLKNVASFKDITESLKTKSGKLVLGKDNIDVLEKRLKDVDFQTMENSILIQHSIVQIPKMTIRSSAMDLDLSGKHTFDNNIDYRFAFRFRDLKQMETKNEFGEVLDDGTGLRLFLRMYGTLDKPIYEWDKEGRKVQAQAYRAEEKVQAKSMLKSEFGFFQKDSTVKAYVPKDVPKEELKIKFGPASKQEFLEEKKQTKDSKLKKTLNTWKEQQEKEQQSGVKLGNGGG